MDKMMHHPSQPWKGTQGNICGKKERTRPPAPPDFNAEIGGCGGAVLFSKQSARLPAPLLQVVHHFVHQQCPSTIANED